MRKTFGIFLLYKSTIYDISCNYLLFFSFSFFSVIYVNYTCESGEWGSYEFKDGRALTFL